MGKGSRDLAICAQLDVGRSRRAVLREAVRMTDDTGRFTRAARAREAGATLRSRSGALAASLAALSEDHRALSADRQALLAEGRQAMAHARQLRPARRRDGDRRVR
jgi:hypothetical protein